MRRLALTVAVVCGLFSRFETGLRAQTGQDQPPPPEHVHTMPMDTPPAAGWRGMQDGVATILFNDQGGPRGGRDLVGLNWWMGMLTRATGGGELTLSTMVSLDAATAGRDGYRELFQVGETLDGEPLIDRQHPHDLFMQLAASWRRPIGANTSLTIGGGLSDEPALGPIAFMHRASAAAVPFAPLSHHTFDSTHITFGVVTAGVDRGRWTVEGSIFNGREPDDERWDFDLGRMDSVSGRVWFRPTPAWSFQVSSGRLVNPEPAEPSTVIRTTASGAWFAARADGFVAIAAGYGANQEPEGTHQAFFGEFSRQAGRMTISSRVEVVQPDTLLLLTGERPAASSNEARTDSVAAFTLAGLYRVMRARALEASVGVSATANAVPASLQASYGVRPLGFQVYVQLRPGSPRMWNGHGGAPPEHHH